MYIINNKNKASKLPLKKSTSTFFASFVISSSLLFMSACVSAYAEERSGLLINTEVGIAYDDNILNTTESTSDSALVLSPDIKYLGLIGKHKFLLSYDGDYSVYNKDSNLNYNDHSFALGARLDHTHRFNTEFKLGYDKKIEEPGSTNSSTLLLTKFNEYDNKSALARVYYGQKTSIGQVVIDFKHNDKEYTNNQQSFRDFVQNQITATFFYRIAPKTRLLFQASTADYDYENQTLTNGLIFNQSSAQNLFLTGVEWEATAKSTGIFKIGYQDKDYNDARFNDISGLSYMLDMIWKPNTYTQVKLGATRQTTESAQLNEAGFVSTSYSIGLSHNIMSRTAVTANYILDNDEIVSGIDRTDRTDKRNTFKLGVKHSLRTWLNLKLAYKYQDKSSNIALFNFESNAIELSLETEFE